MWQKTHRLKKAVPGALRFVQLPSSSVPDLNFVFISLLLESWCVVLSFHLYIQLGNWGHTKIRSQKPGAAGVSSSALIKCLKNRNHSSTDKTILGKNRRLHFQRTERTNGKAINYICARTRQKNKVCISPQKPALSRKGRSARIQVWGAATPVCFGSAREHAPWCCTWRSIKMWRWGQKINADLFNLLY